jgi:hypothetical protein
MRKHNKRRLNKARSIIVLEMLLNCKGGPMHDKRDERGGARNEQRELLNEVDGVSGAHDVVHCST